MHENSVSESKLYLSFRELCESKHVKVEFKKVGSSLDPESGQPSAFTTRQEWRDVILGPDLSESTPRVTELGCRWRSVDPNHPELNGEFRVRNIFKAFLRPAPDLAWEKAPEEEKKLVAEFRTIDDTPRSATGLLTAVRVQPQVNPLELWYYDKDLSRYPGHETDYIRLDLDYSEYMRVLPVTKGTFGWQYLYADVSLHGLGSQVVENLQTMLEVFPRVFPEYDYSDLRTRLEARL